MTSTHSSNTCVSTALHQNRFLRAEKKCRFKLLKLIDAMKRKADLNCKSKQKVDNSARKRLQKPFKQKIFKKVILTLNYLLWLLQNNCGFFLFSLT